MPQDKQSQKEIKKTKIQHKYFCTSFSLCNLSFFPSFSHILPKLSFLALHIYLFIFRKNNYKKMRRNNLVFPVLQVPYIRRSLEIPLARSTWMIAFSLTYHWNTEFFKQLVKILRLQNQFKLKDWSQLHCRHLHMQYAVRQLFLLNIYFLKNIKYRPKLRNHGRAR